MSHVQHEGVVCWLQKIAEAREGNLGRWLSVGGHWSWDCSSVDEFVGW